MDMFMGSFGRFVYEAIQLNVLSLNSGQISSSGRGKAVETNFPAPRAISVARARTHKTQLKIALIKYI